jgi:hypothetical protein
MSLWEKLTRPGKSAASAPQALLTADPHDEPINHAANPAARQPAEKEQMPDDLITSDNVSPELVKSVFDAAFMDATIDSDGDVLVKDAVRVFVRMPEKKDRLRLFCLFGFKSNASQTAQLQCVNLINAEYIMICASAQNSKLVFRYDLLIGSGITKKTLVHAVKRFAMIPQEAVADHGKEIVE